jgi:hypothetical protein
MERFAQANRDLDACIGAWRAEHPAGTLEACVRDPDLWRNPEDHNAQRLAWYSLKHLRDPAAVERYPKMRAAARQGGSAGHPAAEPEATRRCR